MKNISKSGLAVFIILSVTAVFRAAEAFFPIQFTIDPYIAPDLRDQITSGVKSAAELGHTTQKTINTTESNLNNVKTAAMAAYSGELGSLLDVGGTNPGLKEIVDCNYLGHKFKMSKNDDVAELVRLLFLQYPVNPKKDVAGAQKYDKYRQAFYRDSLTEIFAAAGALENELENTLKPSVDETIKCIKGEGTNCATPSPDGNNDAAFVEGKALEATANVYEMMLKVTALKAQLAAVKVIGTSQPAKYVEGVEETPITTEDKTENQIQEGARQESRLDKGAVFARAQVSGRITVAFAQIGMGSAAKASAATSLSDIEVQSKLTAGSPQQIVGETLDFLMAPEDTSSHPYTDAADKMAELDKIAPLSEQVDKAVEVHNLIVKLPEYKSAAEALNEVKEVYERALASLKVSNQCAVDYMKQRYSNPEIAWSGRLLGNKINNADLRKGISGWAIDAYETAKAAEAASTGTENVSSLDIDADTVDLSDISAVDKNNKILDNAGADKFSSSKQEQNAKEAREGHMMVWQIGSEAMHLSADTPAKWGTVKKKEAVWTDTKTFYDQYLQYKYDNIRSYLKSYSKNDVLAVVTERLKGKEAEISDNKKQQAVKQASEQLGQDLAADAAQQTTALKQQNSAHSAQLAALQNKRKAILSKMDNLDAKQKELADRLSDLRSKAQDDAVNSMQAVVTHKTTFPVGGYDVTDEGSEASREVVDADADSRTFSAATAQNKENSEIDRVKQDLDKEKSKLSGLENQLAAVDREIATYKLGAPSKVSSLLSKIKLSKIKKSDAVMDKISDMDIAYSGDVKTALMAVLSQKAVANPLMTPLVLFENIDKAAGKALDELYSKVDARMDMAQKQLEALGEDLYDAKNHARIVEIHQSMVNDIKAMSLTVAAAGIQTIDNIRLYAKLEQADTTAEEEDYFVGAVGKERDLKAPKAIFEMKLPPLREAVHFDEVDWQNVSAYSEGVAKSSAVMKADFLNYGGKIPLVWKQLLKDNAFVEKSIDLKAALNRGCEAVAFYRGGVMPCKVKNSAVILDVDANGKYIKGANSENLKTCANIEMKSGKPRHMLYEIDISFPVFFGSQKAEKAGCVYSELGTLLDADEDGNLYFRQSAYDAFYNTVNAQKHADKERSDKENLLLSVYSQALLNRNLAGDFLDYFESERSQRKNLEETQKDYDEMMQEFFDILKSYGFTPSKSFDLSKQSDYNLARQKLDGIKNGAVSEALNGIGEVDVADNAVVEERVNILKSMIAALQKDKDETTIISAGVDDDNHLDEDIKSSKVNEEVADKFSKSLDKEAAKAKHGREPYCPNY